MNTFPFLLRKFRVAANVSQNELATAAELDHSFISRLESGNRKATRETVETICTLLRLNYAKSRALMESAGYTINAHYNPHYNEILIKQLHEFLSDETMNTNDQISLLTTIENAIIGARRKEEK